MLVPDLQGHLEGVQILGIENRVQRVAIHGAIVLHRPARDIGGVRNLFGQNDAVVSHGLLPVAAAGIERAAISGLSTSRSRTRYPVGGYAGALPRDRYGKPTGHSENTRVGSAAGYPREQAHGSGRADGRGFDIPRLQ